VARVGWLTVDAGVRRWLRGAALLATVSLVLGMSGPPHPRGSIIAIGDSLTRGGFASPGQRWVDILGVIESGRDGCTSADAVAHPWVVPSSIDVVLVEFGVNDYLRGVPSAVFETNMARLLARFKSRVILIAAPAPLDPGASIEPWERYVEAMSRLGQVVDIGTFGPDLFVSDGIHPNDAGNAAMAEIIGHALAAQPELAIDAPSRSMAAR